jgi:hypothetical protein
MIPKDLRARKAVDAGLSEFSKRGDDTMWVSARHTSALSISPAILARRTHRSLAGVRNDISQHSEWQPLYFPNLRKERR